MIDRFPGHGLLENRGQLTKLSSRSDVRGTVSRVYRVVTGKKMRRMLQSFINNANAHVKTYNSL